MVDVQVLGGNGFYSFFAESDRATTWIAQHVDRELWNGTAKAFHVDRTDLAQEIAIGMKEAGLSVAIEVA